jgi:hypothetical protein
LGQDGEQAIFEYDFQTGEATVRLGDIGWDNAHRVVDGQVAGLVLTKSEVTWIYACWLATGGATKTKDADPGKIDGRHTRK